MRSSTLSALAWTALLAQSTGTQAQGDFLSALHPCPANCDGKPEDWTVYNSVKRLNTCNGPMLLDFNVHNALDDADAIVKISACNMGEEIKVNALVADSPTNTHDAAGPDGLDIVNGTEPQPQLHSEKRAALPASCTSGSKSKVSFELGTSGDHSSSGTKSVLNALEKYLSDQLRCGEELVFGFGSGVAVGIHSGHSIDNAAIPTIVGALSGHIDATGQSTIFQLCGKDRNADSTFGIAIDTSGNLAAVQKAVQSWTNATCVDTSSKSSSKVDVEILEVPIIKANGTSPQAHEKLQARGDCRTIQVVSGDGCGPLSKRCGISPQDFTKYNPQKDLCAKLAVGQYVCCSAGTLPDMRPKPNSDGTCAAYTVQSGDFCSKIAAANGLQISDLETFNDKTTWGWFGCDRLLNGLKICLSKGAPPLPAPVSNALCGPTKPGTTQPPKGSNIADLNPCPLNSCCNIWGQCGITPEYCTNDTGPKGNPGTAPTGKNGCVSNCGTKVANNGAGPSSPISIGYYEAFNWERPCLNMRVSTAGKGDYTHMHWAFGNIKSDFSVSIDDKAKQWADFKKIPQKKIISFGGWGYSTSPATYDVLRQAMTPANREAFSNSVAKFVNDEGLDGVDFDWEYPGAPDIPGIPGGLASDGPNYLAFLKIMKTKLNGKSLSIAAPASFWYLRPFPIDKMADQLDYIVYMTYDLHGQWDYGSQWAQEGCPEGSCLRSHVNLTETGYALAMITKAGVKSNKIAVGISSYGRSFGMADPKCSGPDCHFKGTVSNGAGAGSTAKPGRCTNTAGYISNAELNEKLILGENARTWYDQGSDSNLMIYDNQNWVAYMDKDTRKSRTDFYKSLNFAGTIDWAVDLLAFSGDDGEPNSGDGDHGENGSGTLEKCEATYKTLEDVANDSDKIPSRCLNLYTVEALKAVYDQAMTDYNDIMTHHYKDKFDVYSHAVADHISDTMHDFIIKNGNKYFECEVAEFSFCCDDCKQYKDSCQYCFKEGKCSKSCSPNPEIPCLKKRDILALGAPPGTMPEFPDESMYETSLVPMGSRPNTLRARDRGEIIKNIKTKQPCPPDYSKHGYGYLPDNGDPPESSIWWTLVNDKDFYAALAEDTGIPKDKTKIGHFTRIDTCSHGYPGPDSTDDCAYLGYDYNIPVPDHYTAADVANPEDIVEEAQKKSDGLGESIQEAIDEIRALMFMGSQQDLVDSLAIPVLMIREAVYQMSQVVKIADKITEAKRKALILAFIGAILFLIPVVGEVLGSVAELADIAAIVTVIGEAGNVAFDVYSVVDDPDNAPLAIMSIIFAPLALTNVADIAKAAKFRRGMSEADVGKLGTRVGDSLATINKIKKNSCKL